MKQSGKEIKPFRLKDRQKSFRYAFSGIRVLLKEEHNARIHLVILILIIIAGIVLKIPASGWLAIVFASGLVFASECFNTAIENLSDVVSPEKNEKIKIAKDVAAAGVLISAITSVLIGIIVFFPAILEITRK
jgi:diacylglycerol kinase